MGRSTDSSHTHVIRLDFRLSFAYTPGMLVANGNPSFSASAALPPGPRLGPPSQLPSAHGLEVLLGLPAGAWTARRLYALTTRTPAYSALGVRCGDHLVVEPGQRERPGQLVATRGRSGLALRMIDDPTRTQREAELGVLPLFSGAELESVGGAARTVGTVLAILRPDDVGRLRVIQAGHHRRQRNQQPHPDAPPPKPVGSGPGSINRANLPLPERTADFDRVLDGWRRWAEGEADGLGPRTREKTQQLEHKLSTLVGCLHVTHNPRLAEALSVEAAQVVRRLRQSVLGPTRAQKVPNEAAVQH